MLQVIESDEFSTWLEGLRDPQGKARALKQVQRIQLAGRYVGDWKAVGGGVVEIRLMFGPGYRLYVSIEGGTILLLLAGGDKSSQVADIGKARKLLGGWKAQAQGRKGGKDGIQ